MQSLKKKDIRADYDCRDCDSEEFKAGNGPVVHISVLLANAVVQKVDVAPLFGNTGTTVKTVIRV